MASRSGKLSLGQDSYFFFFSGGAGSGKSELNMSATAFQLPTACFFHTTTYLPFSVEG